MPGLETDPNTDKILEDFELNELKDFRERVANLEDYQKNFLETSMENTLFNGTVEDVINGKTFANLFEQLGKSEGNIVDKAFTELFMLYTGDEIVRNTKPTYYEGPFSYTNAHGVEDIYFTVNGKNLSSKDFAEWKSNRLKDLAKFIDGDNK